MADLLIATKAFCNTLKSGSFTGDTTMCPTRSQIESAGLYIKKGYTYATDQLVPQDHIERLDWEYTFSVSPTTASAISAAGGSRQFTVTSYKRQYSTSNAGSHIYVEGSQTNVGYSSSNSGSGTWTSSSNTITYSSNPGGGAKSGTVTWTQNESGKKATGNHSQVGDTVVSRTNPSVSLSYGSDIPAKGSPGVSPTYSYSQTLTWESGRTTTVTTGGSLTFNKISGSVSINSSTGLATAPSKGTTSSGRTSVGTATLTVTMSTGESGTSSAATVYQGPNRIENTSWGSWRVTVSADKTEFEKEGGTTTVRASATRSGTHYWTSESSSNASDSGTPSLRLTNTSGFSLSSSSGTTVTLTVGFNNGPARETTIEASYGGARDTETVRQAIGRQSDSETQTVYSISVNPSPLTWAYNQTSSKSFTVYSTGQDQIRYRYGTPQPDGSVIWEPWGSWQNDGSAYSVGYTSSLSNTTEFTLSDSGNGSGSVSVKSNNTTLNDKTGTVTFTCSPDTSKRASLSLTQYADVQTDTRYQVVVDRSSASFSWEGESIKIYVTPQYQTVRWATGTTKPSWPSTWSNSSPSAWSASISGTGFSQSPSYSSGYTTVTASTNNDTSSGRSGILTVWHDNDSSAKEYVDLYQNRKTMSKTEYEYKYTFSASPTSLSFPASGGTKTTTVTSYYNSRSRTCTSSDGGSTWTCSNWGSWSSNISTGYTGTVSGTGFSGSGNSATASSNSSPSGRDGTLTLKQTRSNSPVTSDSSDSSIPVKLEQVGDVYPVSDGYQFEHELSVNPTSFPASGGTATISVVSRRREIYHMSDNTSTHLTRSWETCPSTQSVSGTGFSKSGNTVNVSANSSTSRRDGDVDSSQNRSGYTVCMVSGYGSDPANINVPLNQSGKTVSTWMVQFDDMTYEFGTNTTITSGEYTGETLGSTWTLWVSEGDKISGIIEIENTGNSTKGYLFYIDNYLDNQKTLTPGQVVSETFSFSDVKSHHTMTLQEA